MIVLHGTWVQLHAMNAAACGTARAHCLLQQRPTVMPHASGNSMVAR